MRSLLVLLLATLPFFALSQERDPTRPPVNETETIASLDSWAEELKLTQILYSEQSQSARLNGQWVKPGERVDGIRVTSIKPNSVIVEKSNEVVEITLFKPIKQNKKGTPGAVQ
ncbi:Type II secretory pathway component [Idiomarina sp. ST10R2A5]|uniref:Type II secretory pathway component n=1 Tax=Idiomarina sp. ST10R2A5 TaxID=3418368 RepID=UPI003EC52FAE